MKSKKSQESCKSDGDADMFLFRLIKKLILFSVLVLILIAKLACKVALDMSSYVIGPLMFFCGRL